MNHLNVTPLPHYNYPEDAPGTDVVPSLRVVPNDEHQPSTPILPITLDDDVAYDVNEHVRNHEAGRHRPASRWGSVPVWAGDGWASLWTGLKHQAKELAKATATKLTWSPVYYLCLSARAPYGVARIMGHWWRWVTDHEGRTVLKSVHTQATMSSAGMVPAAAYAAAPHGAHGMATLMPTLMMNAGAVPQSASLHATLREQHHERIWFRVRLNFLLLGVLLFNVAMLTILFGVPTGHLAAMSALTAPVLGWYGRDRRRPVIPTTLLTQPTSSAPPFTGELVANALSALGISALTKGISAGDLLIGPGPIVRDGQGWRVEMDLPIGVTAGDVCEKRDRLAANLRRPLACVWPEGDPDTHDGRLIIWVGDKPLSQQKPAVWPLASKGGVDIFNPFPIGVDPRGRIQNISLMWNSMIIGAQPRQGKTFSLRLLLIGAALDPRVEIHAYDWKGGSDLLPLAGIAHTLVSGSGSEEITTAVHDLTQLKDRMEARYSTLKTFPRDLCPEGKATPALASDKRYDLHPIILAFDECQLAFEDPEHGKTIEALMTDLVKRGPAAGIIVINATQRPDAKSLPPGISAQATLRFCLKVRGHVENDMVLGTGSYKRGTTATMFGRADKGTGYLAGEADDPAIVRTYYLDAPAAEHIVARSCAQRQAQDRLTGMAAGITPDVTDDTANLLEHLLAIWPAGQARAWSSTLATRLAETYPGTYDGWGPEQIAAGVKPFGISTRQVKIAGRNQRGLLRDDLTAAAEHLANGGNTSAA